MINPPDKTTEQHSDRCPLASVDRRLDDLHRQWHAAREAYFDPESFRVAIQTSIQTLRTVTFILQSSKRLIPGFDAWYAAWQEKMKADPLLCWMRDARNKIEKQGDLEAHSFVRAEIIASYLAPGPRVEVPAELFDTPDILLQNVPASAVGDHVRRDGILRIERRWVESSLPDYELLDAVAHAYGRISLLVADAHRQAGLRAPVTTDTDSGEAYPAGSADGRLPCMVGHADARSIEIWLATGEPIRFEQRSGVIDLAKAKSLETRYALTPAEMFGSDASAEAQLASLFATARTMFLKDGHHIFIVFLLRQGKPVRIVQLRPAEHGEKYLMLRGLGHEVIKLEVDAVIVISEAWSAPMNRTKPYMRAVDSPHRQEHLGATLVSRSGEPLMLQAEIQREGDVATLGITSEHRVGAHFMFAPIYEAWHKPIPREWSDMKRFAAADSVKGAV